MAPPPGPHPPPTDAAASDAGLGFRQLADALPQFVWVTEPDGRLSYVNRRWRVYAGLTLEESQAGEALYARFHPDDRERVVAAWRDAFDTGTPLEVEARIRGADGAHRWFLIRTVPTHDAAGAVVRWFGTSTDITAQKASEEALRRSERWLQAMANAMPQVVWVSDTAGVVHYYNDRVSAFAGVRRNPDGTWGWEPAIHPDDFDATAAAWQRAVHTGVPYSHEHRLRMADGSYRWHLSRAVPVPDADGVVERWYGTATDIHELKQAEAELDRRRREFQTLIEHSPDIVARFDPELRYRYVNPAVERVTGRPITAYLGKTFAELGMPPDVEALWTDRCRAVFATGQEHGLEFTYATTEGVRHFRSRLAPEFGPDGAVESLVAVTYDVTERARAERERQTLLDALTHDLKNPLAALKVQAQMQARQVARRGVPDAPTLVERLEGFERLATRMTELVDELADHARLAAGEFVELERAPMDLVALVRSSADEVRQIAWRHEIRFVPEVDALPGEWDERRLRRVLANLLNNAVKYSPEGGHIRVGLGVERSAAMLTVADEGIGIPGGDLPRIFDLRHRGGNVGAIEGSGVGLAGVKRIVEHHGGTIEVTSEEGRGTTVTVRLPLREG